MNVDILAHSCRPLRISSNEKWFGFDAGDGKESHHLNNFICNTIRVERATRGYADDDEFHFVGENINVIFNWATYSITIRSLPLALDLGEPSTANVMESFECILLFTIHIHTRARTRKHILFLLISWIGNSECWRLGNIEILVNVRCTRVSVCVSDGYERNGDEYK